MRKLLIALVIIIPSIIWSLSYDSGEGGGGGGGVSVNGTSISPSTVTANNIVVSCITVTGSSASFNQGALFNSNRLTTAPGAVQIQGGSVATLFYTDPVNNKVGIANTTPLAGLDVGNCASLTLIDGGQSDMCVGDDAEILDDLYVIGQAQFGLPQDAAPRTNVTATTIFQQIVNTGATPNQVCIATGTTATTQWVLLSNFSTPCSN